MTEQREFYAANVEEAVEKAASELGVAPTDLSYRVVDTGNSGFLGIGARDARIEVEAPPAAEPAEPETVDSEEEPQDYAQPVAEDAGPPESEPDVTDLEVAEPQGVPGVFVEEDEREEIPEEMFEEVRQMVVSLLDAMGFESRIEVYDAGGYVAVDVASGNTALFIGQKGETIDSLQYLINASINKRRSTRVRIVLDAEGYRQRRVEAIQGMAHRTARKAVRERRVVELPPMNPAERRVVHLFLQDKPEVTTDSQGTGDDRRVRVSPV